MSRSFRRIWGFGLVGWLMLPVAAFLAYCALGGLDLTHALLRLWFETMGWGWLLWLLDPALHYSWSLQTTLFGPISLTYLLLSLYLAPRRWSWWVWCLAVVWTMAQPALWWLLAGGQRGGTLLDRLFGASAGIASAAVLAIGTALGVWLMTRCRWVLGSFVGATGIALACEASLRGSTFDLPRVYHSLETIWHCLVGSTLIAWAIIERRQALRETSVCRVCGYDLAGIAAGVCPECGLALRRPIGANGALKS